MFHINYHLYYTISTFDFQLSNSTNQISKKYKKNTKQKMMESLKKLENIKVMLLQTVQEDKPIIQIKHITTII